MPQSNLPTERFKSFAEFYPYYLGEHANPICRALHYIGSLLALAFLGYAIWSAQYGFIALAVISGYAFAWIGHFFFEHNKPATFKYPVWSLMGDWIMLKDFFLGRIK